MFTRPRPAKICARCLARRYLSTSTPQSTTTLPPPPPPSGAAKLTNRRLLALSGHDATHFLQGIVTQNIRPSLTSGLYTAFLNAQGRVLHDVFIYPTTHSSPSQGTPPSSQPFNSDPGYLIEVDAAETSRLLSHIKKHKLRAKLTARVVDEGEWEVWSVWDAGEKWTPHSSRPQPETTFPSPSPNPNGPTVPTPIGCIDPRAPGLGRRLVLPSSQTPASLPPAPSADPNSQPHPPELTTLDSYTLRRILHGVPEGQSELPYAAALPMEANMDYMGGIDFRKGCYVGQELTIRTRHTGVVRKRILPVRLYAPEEGADGKVAEMGLVYDEHWKGDVVAGGGANIVRVGVEGRAAGRSAGKWVAGVGNVGLALCRLEAMAGVGGEFKVVREDGGEEVMVKAFVPGWHLGRGGVTDVGHGERSM